MGERHRWVLSMQDILFDIRNERHRQVEKWGIQHHPDGTEDEQWSRSVRDCYREVCTDLDNRGEVTWRAILEEEVYEAFAEEDPKKLREELIQSAAVIAAWVEDIDSREEEPVEEAS